MALDMSLQQLRITEYRLRLARRLFRGEATLLRGYFGRFFEEVETQDGHAKDLLHNHGENGQFYYRYPRVQFKVLDHQAHILGIEEGAVLLERLWPQVQQICLQDETLPIQEIAWRRRQEPFGETDCLQTYRFLTPWLPLNQENHRRYQRASTEGERRRLLSRVLIGNLLSLAKSFDHYVRQQLVGEVVRLWPVDCRVKGVTLRGFRGEFRTNFLLPEHIGLGKLVSRGFGTLMHRRADSR
jgi:hypothetical protein